MKKIKSYEDFMNEEINWRKGLAGAAIGASLAMSPSVVSGQEVNKTELSVNKKNSDPVLNDILSEIKSNFNSEDNAKYNELFNKLSSHLESKYQFKIEQRDIPSISAEEAGGMSMLEIIGWLGSICLAISGLPQAWMSYKERNSRGISWSFLLLWSFGEIFALAYVWDKLDLPLITNYVTNLLVLGVILYYKINPGDGLDTTTSTDSSEEELDNVIKKLESDLSLNDDERFTSKEDAEMKMYQYKYGSQ